MEWVIDNFALIIGIACLIAMVMVAVINFVKAGKEKQLATIKEWLLLAVTEAEKELGSNTGQLKLRMVYSQFIDKFKYMSLLITFDEFSLLVDDALDKMRDMLNSNQAVKELVVGDKEQINKEE